MWLNTRKSDGYKRLRGFPLVVGALLVISSCNTREVGCLDPDASKFDLTAEKDCPDCCTYPSLSISLSQKWDDRTFAVTDTLKDMHQQPYLITDIRFLLSSWRWTDLASNRYTVDSVQFECENESFLYTPDLLLIDPRLFTYTLGTIRTSPQMDSVFLSFGLAQDFSCADPADPDLPVALQAGSPVRDPATGTLHTMRLILKRNPQVEVLDTLFVSGGIPIALAYPFSFDRGINTQWRISVNYADWFRDVDVLNLDSFQPSVLAGLQGSFFPTP